MNTEAQRELATALRKARDLREANYRDGWYHRSSNDCACEATDNASWAPIVACLLTAGYCETWEFCDAVLGPEPKEEEEKTK